MGRESFVLVSLKEEKAKKLAQVISNESCRQILDYLADVEASESDLASKLSIPISTVHYNLKHLVDAGLVSAEEFHYSQKGKEVLHYKLSNKFVIIAPKSTFGLKEKLRSILPVGILTVAVAGTIQLLSMGYSKTMQSGPIIRSFTSTAEKVVGSVPMADSGAPSVAQIVPTMADMASEAGGGAKEALTAGSQEVVRNVAPVVHNVTIQNATTQVIEKTTEVVKEYTTTKYVIPDNIAFWFICGALFAILLYLLVEYIRKKRKS